jgi:predicted dithiol-disulfide oxidoreductase (DUF899 family)
MQYAETAAKLAQYRQQIAELRNRVRELKQSVEPEKVADYEFSTPEGKVHLSELFGEKQYLFVIHNMGAGCRYCTLWADGFNGILQHIENRAGFVLTSPDEAAAQQKFKTGRGWRFRMVSHRDTSFAEDMGYRGKDGWLPGVSVFVKSAACPTTALGRATISAPSGISSTCCPKVPMAGNRSTNTIDL